MAEELVGALESIANGQIYINANISKKIIQQFLSNEDNPLQQLSAREFETFRLLAEGSDSSIIATTLNISSKTIANYQTSIKQKLGLNNSVELVRLTIRHGLIDS